MLASEIARPKACSLRTLDMIRNMSPEEAKFFSSLCRYVMQSGNTYYIDSAGFSVKKMDIRDVGIIYRIKDYLMKSISYRCWRRGHLPRIMIWRYILTER